jgi:hypothetical protein
VLDSRINSQLGLLPKDQPPSDHSDQPPTTPTQYKKTILVSTLIDKYVENKYVESQQPPAKARAKASNLKR